MTEPLSSVIIPTYNRAEQVCEAIDNVFQQTYKRIELIVVDDGSTDNTPQRLREYGKRISVVTQSNAGPAVARNRGLAVARGEIIAFQDSDDLWKPTKLEQQIAMLERAGKDVPCCICNASFGVVKGTELTSFKIADIEPVHEQGLWMNPSEVLATRFLLFNQVVAIRRQAIEKAGGFDESLKYLEDYDLPLRLAAEGPWAFIQKPLVTYRMGAANSFSQRAANDPITLIECEITIFERALKRATVGPNAMLTRRLAARLRSLRRRRLAARLLSSSSAVTRAEGAALARVEHIREALFRRSARYPKPMTVPLHLPSPNAASPEAVPSAL